MTLCRIIPPVAVFSFALTTFLSVAPVAAVRADESATVGAAVAPANPMPSIVPAVRQWTGGVGSVDIRNVPVFISVADAAALRPTAEVLAEDMVALGLPRPEIIVGDQPAGKTGIVFALTDKPFNAGAGTIEEQAYSVEITPAGVVIRAHNNGGVFAGTRAMVQMALSGGLKKDGKAAVACGKITDAPVTKMRILMLDAGRKAFPLNTLYDHLRVLGWYRMNALHLHLSDNSFDNRYAGFRVQCDTFPGLTSKDCFYTKKELREFQDRAAAMGIMVIPEIDMPGHAAGLCAYWPDLAWRKNPYGKGALDVNKPDLLPRMKQLIDEMIPIFDAPYMHIGTDEYRVDYKDAAEKLKTGENFRKFINEMNRHIRSKGKECVVWDGWEHVAGETQIDPTVVVDMWWGIFDTNAYLKRGHKVINSNQGVTYLTAGRPVYGVSNPGLYQNWKPNKFGKVNPPMDAPGFLGAKLHVWCGQGPTGWTMTEIAGETFESVRAVSETLWGVKGSPDYKTFLERAAPLETVPGVTTLERLPAGENGVVLDKPDIIELKKDAGPVALPLDGAARADLEFPWTLTMEIRKDADNGRGVILSSKLSEICTNYEWNDRKKVVNAAEADRGKEKFEKIIRHGFGIDRATGNWKGENPTPVDTTMGPENSRVYDETPLPVGTWVKYTVVAEKRHTRVYRDGKLVGESRGNIQSLCPLMRLGSPDAANGFVGAVRNLRVINRAEAPR